MFADRTGKTSGVFALHQADGGKWVLSVHPLKNGSPAGAWSKLFDLTDIKDPTDADMDSAGNFYVSSSAANQVYKLDKTGKILARFGKNEGPRNGRYDPKSLASPSRLCTWKDTGGRDRIVVVEPTAYRVSEWFSDGTLSRQWFLCREAARGFCMDRENPQDVYQAASGALFRYKVDYDKPGWKLDAFSTEHSLGGLVYPQILNVKGTGKKYLAFPGGNDSGYKYGIYRIEGDKFIPSAALIRKGKQIGKNEFWWRDANGNGQVEEDEYKNNPARMVHEWDGQYWLDDLSLVMTDPKDSFLTSLRFLRMKPSSFDAKGNPIFKTAETKALLEDRVYKAVVNKKADIFHGGNEIASGYGSWERVVAGPEGDYYLAYNFGPNGWGGVDTAGVRHCMFKLCRLVPDGGDKLKMKWRVGRKAWGVAEPGQVYGSFHLMPPSPGGSPALDGSLAGWETAQPVKFGMDKQRKAEVRCMYDRGRLYLHWRIRMPDQFKPAEDKDLVRIFTHDRQATTASFYIQCDPNAAGGRDTGRPGDARVVLGVVGDPARPRPVALGMYPTWKGPDKGSPMTYISPTGKAPFGHVAVLKNARLGFALDPDKKGFSLAAAIPLKDLPGLPQPGSKLRTMVDFSVTLNGSTAFWWANTLGLNNTLTTDEPSETKLYPGSWAPAQFTGIEVLPIRQWSVCGPWGGESFKEDKANAGGGAVGGFFTRFYMNAKYPPETGEVDLKKTYKGPDTRDWEGKEREVKWRTLTTPRNTVVASGNPFRLYFAATWVWAPSDILLECSFHTNEGGTGNCRGWINGQRMPEVNTRVHGINARELVRKGKLKFKKGWNRILLRGWGHWVPTTFGITIGGPGDLLWQIKVSPTPPR